MSFEMSLNVSVISCLLLVSISAQQIDVIPTNNGTIKETIYDINLYITVPASVVALGLLFCLCYCLVCACRDPFRDPEQQGMRPFQPVIVTNRSSPLVISSQNTSHNESVEEANVSSGPNQTNNTQKPQQNQSFLDRIWNRKNTTQTTAPKSGEPKKYQQTAHQKTGTQITSNGKQNLLQSNPSTSKLGSTSRQSRSPYQRQEPVNTSQSHYKTQAKKSANPSVKNSMESDANQLEDSQSEDFDLDQNSGTTSKKSKQAHMPSNTSESVGMGAEDGYSG